MGEVQAADRRSGKHGKRFRQVNAGALFGLQQVEQDPFFGVVRARGIARSRTDSTIALSDEILRRQAFFFAVPPCLADFPMQPFGKRFGKPVGQRFCHDRVVIIMVFFESLAQGLDPDSRGHRKPAQVIRKPR